MTGIQKDLKILVVEDNPGDFVLIEEYLSEGFDSPEVTNAKTFHEAEKYLNINTGFHIILLDLSLPDLSGESLVKKMMDLSGQIPVIVLTGYENQEFGLNTLSMGVTDYLLKDEISPFVLSKIISFSIERSRINQAVKESEKKYRKIFNLSPQPMFLIDTKSRRILDVNEAALDQYGYGKKEFVGLHLKDIRPEDSIADFEEKIDKIDKNETPFYQTSLRHKRKNGEAFDVDLSTSDIIIDGKPLRMALAEDVTDKIAAERALAKRSRLLAANAEVSGALIKSDDWLNVLDDTLEVIGEAVSVDRVYLFESHTDPQTNKKLLSQRIEWTKNQEESQINNEELQNIEQEYFPDILSKIENNEVFQAIIKELPNNDLKKLFTAQNILSILILPIFDGNTFYGFIGFDDCINERIWEPEEIQYLKVIASNVSSAIKLRRSIDEQELSEKRFKALVQEGSDLIAILDEELKFKYVSPSIGEDYESYEGVKSTDLVHPDDREKVEKSIKRIQDQKRIVLSPYRLGDSQGNYHWVETIITDLLDEPAIAGFVANSRNVTEQIKREKELKESLERYDIVSKATSDTIWDLNIETDTIEYNSNIHSMFGYKENEIDNINLWWRQKIHPEDIETVNNALTEVLKKGKERFQIAYRFKAADGSYKYIFDRAFVIKDEDDKPVRMIGAMQDISHEVEEQERLKLLESVITNTKESVVITEAESTDLKGRKILYVNEAFTTLTGYKKEEAIGQTIHFLNGPETDRSKRAELGKAMDKHEAKEVEFINYKKNGEKFWINISMVPVADDDGNYTHWVAIGRDITDQKQNEEEIKASLKEKETLLAEIHHRVKNNLAVVSGMMQLQAFDSDNEELQAKLFDSVVRIKSIATVHELLYQSNSFSQLDFSDTLKKLIENISETLQSTKDISLDINCDPVQLNINQAIPASLIVNEVITNAYKHAFKGTKNNRLSFDLSEDENSIHIEIKDNGVGLPDDKIMETKNSLGFHLIEVLCGQIDGVKEYKNGKKGTIFTLTFKKNETKGGSGNAQLN